MAQFRFDLMSPDDVQTIAKPILEKAMRRFGFQSVAVSEEEDFDGKHVFRVTANVQSRVPAAVLLDALDSIHEILRGKGEERFVYLSTHRPGDEEQDQDTD